MNYSARIVPVVVWAAMILPSFSLSTMDRPAERKDKIVAAWERAKAYTKEYMDAATEEVYSFKPTPEMRSFAEQMHHLAVDNYKITSAAVAAVTSAANYKDLEKEPPVMKKAALTNTVMESYDFVIAAIKEIDEAKLDTTVKMFNKWE